MDWLEQYPEANDFSTQVLPNYIGQIATWHKNQIHRDIGNVTTLQQAQHDPRPAPVWIETDECQEDFLKQPIHLHLRKYVS